MTGEPACAHIPSLPADAERPTWSVLIPTYNCADFLEEALTSVLVQDPGPAEMEIIVIDDHSAKDDPSAVVSRIGGDRVRFYRQDRNVGKVRNFETGLLMSRGRLIHQLHGDDRVGPGFYAAIESAFREFPTASAFFTESNYIDETGRVFGRTGRESEATGPIEGWLDLIVVEQRVQAPSIVLRREVYETLGGFDRRLDMVEDWEMWIRVASRYIVGFVSETRADYRVSGEGTTAESVASGKVFGHVRRMTQIVDGYLPREVVERCDPARRVNLSRYFTQLIPALIEKKNYPAIGKVYKESLTLNPRLRTLYRLLHFTIRHKQYLRASIGSP